MEPASAIDEYAWMLYNEYVPRITSDVLKDNICDEFLFYFIGNHIWKNTFSMVYFLCEACVHPQISLSHICLILWNEQLLIEYGYARNFCNKYLNNSINSINWLQMTEIMNSFPLFARSCDKCDHSFWKTRNRKKYLVERSLYYAEGFSIGEQYEFLLQSISSILSRQ